MKIFVPFLQYSRYDIKDYQTFFPFLLFEFTVELQNGADTTIILCVCYNECRPILWTFSFFELFINILGLNTILVPILFVLVHFGSLYF